MVGNTHGSALREEWNTESTTETIQPSPSFRGKYSIRKLLGISIFNDKYLIILGNWSWAKVKSSKVYMLNMDIHLIYAS